MTTSKKKKEKFLAELSELTKKYDIWLETTDFMFLCDDGGDIGGVVFDFLKDEYKLYK
jgi:oligoribonuclease NrnB/cAMP/cGMP phosphodiesterase (DHH superfamily)